MASSMILGDKLVVGVARFIRLDETIKPGSRSQVTINDLLTISKTLNEVIGAIQDFVVANKSSKEAVTLAFEFDSLNKHISSLINNNIDCISYDDKLVLAEKYNQCLLDFELAVGKFLTTNEFTYADGKAKYLKHIVDSCINNGYFFFF